MFTLIIVLPLLYVMWTYGGSAFLSHVLGDTFDTSMFLMFGMPLATFVLCVIFRSIRKIVKG